MRKLLSYILVLAFALPLVAQESESKDEAKDEKVVRQHDKKDWDRGDMRKRMGMQRANQERKKMHKKRAIRSAVRIIVVGGLAYYIGYHQGEEHFNGGWDRRKDWSDRK